MTSTLSWRVAATLLGLLGSLALSLPARAQQAADDAAASVSERLTVADPYLEMRTGPGRGYPVFFVVERGQAVVVELRHTDWYKVRADGGQLGGCKWAAPGAASNPSRC
jgi:uncharacterized protein YraI